MSRLIRWIFSQTKIGQYLDGKKTIIGAALVLASAILQALLAIAPMFPEQPWIATFAVELEKVLAQVQPFISDLGIGLIGVGLAHKAAKNQR
jgi:hypothetical protein